MEHFTPVTESTLAATCWDYDEFSLLDWLDGDDRLLVVYYSNREADHPDDLPNVEVIGAAASADQGFSEVFSRAELAALIGAEYVSMMEESKAEEVAA
jgi:hypothetical protein